MKDWLILLCIGVIAVLAFRERDLWLPQRAPVAPLSAEASATPQESTPLPTPPEVATAATPDPSKAVELAAAIAQSQRAAVAKYPALGVAGSEMNIRFAFRYKNLLTDHSPRLRDPAWPLQLADECARDLPARAAAAAAETAPAAPKAPTPLVAVASPAATPPDAAHPANAPVASLRVPNAATAAAQTLVFSPGNAIGVPPGHPPAATSAKPAGSLPFVTLDAVNQKSANDFRYHWFYGYDYYDISFRQSVGISMTVRNMSREAAAVNLRWLFFARQGHNSERFIFGASGKELDLAPGQNESLTADSPMLQRREVNDSWLGQRFLSGSKYEGWLVQLVDRGSKRVIKQTGSTSYLEDLAKKTDFSSLVDDYRSKLGAQGGTDSSVFTR